MNDAHAAQEMIEVHFLRVEWRDPGSEHRAEQHDGQDHQSKLRVRYPYELAEGATAAAPGCGMDDGGDSGDFRHQT